LPATSDGTGADAYGKDSFYFDKAAARAAFHGGNFSNTTRGGVFCLILSSAPSISYYAVGFRAAKAL